ncbi:5'-3' exonuclease [Priestia megaterium]|nr:5'-3' exonuclease [Priestia megaterium]
MEKLFLIDGSSMLATNFFGTIRDPNYFKTGETSSLMKTKDGVFTNGVFSMTKELLKIISVYGPSHLAVAWDISRNTFRKSMFPEYKGHRDETKPELSSQFKVMQLLLEEMNIPQFSVENYEADDIIGTFSRKFQDEIEVVIFTKDQDALQLITNKTHVWLKTSNVTQWAQQMGKTKPDTSFPYNTFKFTPENFKLIYGIAPEQMIDKKALEGDSSDNIPGVAGIGKKTVDILLAHFSTIEELYNKIEGLTDEQEKDMKAYFKKIGITRSPLPNLLKESTANLVGKKAAFLSKKLATIETDIPELKPIPKHNLKLSINEDGMKKSFQRLEFYSLLS